MTLAKNRLTYQMCASSVKPFKIIYKKEMQQKKRKRNSSRFYGRSLEIDPMEQVCSLVLTQETPEVCPFLGLPIVHPTIKPTISSTEVSSNKPKTSSKDHEKPTIFSTEQTLNIPETSKRSYKTVGITLSILVLVIVALYFILRDPNRRSKILSICRKNTPPVHYTRVETNEEANLLLLPQEGQLTDSDDDIII